MTIGELAFDLKLNQSTAYEAVHGVLLLSGAIKRIGGRPIGRGKVSPIWAVSSRSGSGQIAGPSYRHLIARERLAALERALGHQGIR